MPTKPKYDYDINKIEDLQNKGVSLRETARRLNFPEIAMYNWIKRNYDKVIKYTKKDNKK